MTAPAPKLTDEAAMIVNVIATVLRQRTAWDELPSLCQIGFERKAGRDLGTLSEMPIDPAAWDVLNPPEFLTMITDDLEEAYADAPCEPGGTMVAIAFRYESWTLPDAEPGTAEASEAAAAALGRRIHARPDRVEARVMQAVDQHGTLYMALQRRDSDQVQVKIAPADVPLDTGDQIPGILRRLANVIFHGTPAGERS